MESKKYYWLKLKREFFKRHDVCIVEQMENGHEILLLYIKLLCESIDHNGELRFNDYIAYTPRMLAAVFGTKEEIITQAIEVLTEFELMSIKDDGTICLTKFADFVGCDTSAAVRKRNQRNLPTLKNGSKRLNGSSLITPDGKSHNVDEKRYGGHGMQALDRALGKCELCGSDENIVVHHNNGYSNELDDLVCLCVSCHGKVHNKTNGGHVDIKRETYVHRLSTTCPPLVQQMSIQSIENRDKRKENRVKSIDKRFVPPTLDDVTAYCVERNSPVDPIKFFEYYDAGNWKDSKGNPVKNWKQKLITWERKESPKTSGNEFLDLLGEMEDGND